MLSTSWYDFLMLLRHWFVYWSGMFEAFHVRNLRLVAGGTLATLPSRALYHYVHV